MNNAVIWDDALSEKFDKEVPKWKVITPALVSERLKINGSLARQGLARLHSEGKVKSVVFHNSQRIYTKVDSA